MTAYSDSHPDSIWLYQPSTALAIVFTVLYFVPTVYSFYLTVLRYRSWFFLCVLIGGILEVVGYIFRVVSVKNQDSIPPYAVSQTLIILAPIFVAAGNYLLIGRLIRAALDASHQRILRIQPHRITKIFVGCDIMSFLIQASGSGIAASVNWVGSTADIGQDVLLAGLGTQVATFVFFIAILVIFILRVKREGERADSPDGWRKVLYSVCISSALVLIRSIYRVIEFGQGIDGYTFTHEWPFYVFEALPMLPAITIFTIFHPAKYLTPEARKTSADVEARTSMGTQF
ncbi:RTA1-domain-containing protein [Rhizodiscina lignyota]|uniref:RTA1-domain-containing protein n=1 Tax=Rhizodiscina lignyota TaxID=1504668 RepID=A0A9P4MBG3_9PEZI|nr:RTA1-domain-containing protein [Rhizodiscina lignyota]